MTIDPFADELARLIPEAAGVDPNSPLGQIYAGAIEERRKPKGADLAAPTRYAETVELPQAPRPALRLASPGGTAPSGDEEAAPQAAPASGLRVRPYDPRRCIGRSRMSGSLRMVVADRFILEPSGDAIPPSIAPFAPVQLEHTQIELPLRAESGQLRFFARTRAWSPDLAADH